MPRGSPLLQQDVMNPAVFEWVPIPYSFGLRVIEEDSFLSNWLFGYLVWDTNFRPPGGVVWEQLPLFPN